MISKDEIYTSRLILNSVLPVIKVIVESKEKFLNSFAGKTGKIQFSIISTEGKVGTHFDINNGTFEVALRTIDSPDLEFEFRSVSHFNRFFTGKTKKLPIIHGWYRTALLIPMMKVLLYMPKLLLTNKPHVIKEEMELFVKLMFYIATSGISQLNKIGHPEVSEWAKNSPDRVISMEVKDRPEFAAYFRVKMGETKSARGKYTRSKPFLTLMFDSVESAMRMIMGIDDMISAAEQGKVTIMGPPEYGGTVGNFLFLVGAYTK